MERNGRSEKEENGGGRFHAQRPLEYVCVFPLEFPTEEGDALFHFAVDGFSKMLYVAGSDLKDKGARHELLIQHLQELLEQEGFRENLPQGATFVFHAYEEHRPAIETVLRPYGAVMAIDEPTVMEEMKPVVEAMVEDGKLMGKRREGPEDH